MDPTRQQVIDDLIHDLHFGRDEIVTSEVAADMVAELHAMEASGRQWISELIDDLAAIGAQKRYADWRRRYTIPAQTKKGTSLELPEYAAALTRDDEGKPVYTQLRLLDMTLPQLIEHRARMVKARDTTSVRIRLLSDLIEAMEADSTLTTARDALARLEAA